MKPNLKVVAKQQTLAEEIELTLIARRQALQALAWADADLLALRRRYASERGEFLLPTIERLQREFLS